MKKRSSKIDLKAMRKSPAVLTALVATTAMAVSGCDDEPTEQVRFEEPQEKVKVVSSVEDCVAKTSMTEAQCQKAYDDAKEASAKSAPKYNSYSDCVAQFGPNMCQQGSGSNSDVWMPLMAGFMVGNMLSSGSSAQHHYHPVYTSRTGNYVNSSGTTLGKPGASSYTVSKSSYSSPPKTSTVSSTASKSYTAPKPTVTKTADRGGFGSKSSAKSSWGSSSKSSGSWGG